MNVLTGFFCEEPISNVNGVNFVVCSVYDVLSDRVVEVPGCGSNRAHRESRTQAQALPNLTNR